jgi:hypothetical protein
MTKKRVLRYHKGSNSTSSAAEKSKEKKLGIINT